MISWLKKSAFNILYSLWNRKQENRITKIKNFDVVYVLDIDNTLTQSNLNDPIDHLDPIPRAGMISFVQNLNKTPIKLIYLSARDFRLFNNTKSWLKSNQVFNAKKNDLFLVRSSFSKIKYLEILIRNNDSIIFIDDLTYNHENGKAKFYHETKEKLSNLNLEYRGLEFIEAQ